MNSRRRQWLLRLAWPRSVSTGGSISGTGKVTAFNPMHTDTAISMEANPEAILEVVWDASPLWDGLVRSRGGGSPFLALQRLCCCPGRGELMLGRGWSRPDSLKAFCARRKSLELPVWVGDRSDPSLGEETSR